MFEVTITEIVQNDHTSDLIAKRIVRYTQSVDALDMGAVMQAVNRKPRKPRVKKVPEPT